MAKPEHKSTRLTVQNACEYVRRLGMSLIRTAHDEFHVRFVGDPKGHGYFTSDLEDAVRTAKAMFEVRFGRSHQGRYKIS